MNFDKNNEILCALISIPSCSTRILTVSVRPFKDANIRAVHNILKKFQILLRNIK